MKKKLRDTCIIDIAQLIYNNDKNPESVPTLCGREIIKENATHEARKSDCPFCKEEYKMIEYLTAKKKEESTTKDELEEDEPSNEKEVIQKTEKRKAGRPKKDDKRSVIKPIRWTEEQWKEIEEAAELMKLNPSKLIRSAVLSQVREAK